MPRLSNSAVVLLLGLGLLTALDGWSRVAERAGYSVPPALGRHLLRDALDRQTAVRADLAATLERRRRTEELTAAVMHERLTLREAAARLRDLYRAAPDFPWETVERRFPGCSDEECCCRLLIGEMRSLEGPDRERARVAALRLEAQLESASRGRPPSESV